VCIKKKYAIIGKKHWKGVNDILKKFLLILLLILLTFLLYSCKNNIINSINNNTSNTKKLENTSVINEDAVTDIYTILDQIKVSITKNSDIPVLLPAYIPPIKKNNPIYPDNKYYTLNYQSVKEYYYIVVGTANKPVKVNSPELTYVPADLKLTTIFSLCGGKNEFLNVKYPPVRPKTPTYKKVNGILFETDKVTAYARYKNWDVYLLKNSPEIILQAMDEISKFLPNIKGEIKKGRIIMQGAGDNAILNIEWTSTNGYSYWLNSYVNASETLKLYNSLYNSQAPSNSQSISFIHLNMITEKNGWAIGQKKVYRTMNGGATWKDVTPTGTDEIYAWYFLNSDTAWILSFNGILYRTEDGGKINSDKGTGLLYSNDGGQSWKRMHPPAVPFDSSGSTLILQRF